MSLWTLVKPGLWKHVTKPFIYDNGVLKNADNIPVLDYDDLTESPPFSPPPVGIPSGTVITSVSNTPPSGFLYCDGSAVSRVTYSALFAIIGVSFGKGNGTTTFNLPDLRGLFVRYVDDGAGNDPDAASRTAPQVGANTGDNIGSIQPDDIIAHSHFTLASNPDPTPASRFQTGNSASGQLNTNATGGNETRPKNLYFKAYIKT